MGKIAHEDEINFNYPIPRSLHKNVRRLSLEYGIPVKDIVINALVAYLNDLNEDTTWKGEGL